jgi:aminoglycoside phosphotransferase (APT) family kinase protein
VIAPSVLARIPGCETGRAPQRITTLSGGKLNKSFRVDTGAGSFVLRLNDPAGALLGANHQRERELHRAAGIAGVAPELVYADDAERFMIVRYVEGRTWEAADYARPQSLRKLGALLRTLHAISPPLVAPFDLGAILRDHSVHLIAALPAERKMLESLLMQAENALALCAGCAREATIVHNDLYHANIIEGGRIYLIDWEYAAVADPIFDVACVLAYYPASERYARDFLEAADLADVPLPVLARARFVFMFLSFLWYRRRRLNGAVAAEDVAAEHMLLQSLNGLGSGICGATSAD